MKALHPDKHQQIIRMGVKNSDQKGVAKILATEVEKKVGRTSVVRIADMVSGGKKTFISKSGSPEKNGEFSPVSQLT